MKLPIPEPGMVIGYSYLWAREHGVGREEGVKDRPCAIVTVVPITHTPPHDPAEAVEIPAVLKNKLGLDESRSWVVVSETNDFLWPGPDLRAIPGRTPARIDYGMLPSRFYAHVRDKILQAHLQRKLTVVPRSE